MIWDRAVLEAVRDSVFIADGVTGNIVDANPAAEALCGRSLAEIRSLHYTQLHPPEEVEWARSGFVRATQFAGPAQATLLHKDGHRIPVEITSSHFMAPDGRRMLIGAFRDTTERNAAWEALRRSEERFRQVAETAGDFIWEVDPKGLYLYASPAVEELLGYPPEEIVGRMHFHDFFAPENREEMMAAAFGVFARREPVRAHVNSKVRRDGKIAILETNAVPVHDAHGKFLGYRGSDRNITERRRAEEAVDGSENKYRVLIETTDTGYVIVDSQGRVTDANEQYVELTGHEQLAEILGRNVMEWTAPHDQERNAGEVRKCFERGFVRNLEMDYVDRHGEITSIEINATVIGSGDLLRVLALCRDITERKIVKKELVRQSEFIQAALENISDGVVACDSAGDLALFNRAAREWHGIDACKLPADQWASYYDLFGPDGTTPLATQSIPLRRAFCGEHFHDAGMTIAAKGQPLRHIQASGRHFYDNEGHKLGAVVAMHDVTEYKQAEQALRQSEERFRATFEQAAVGIAHVAPNGRFLRVNRRFCEIAGYSKEEMLERTFQEITHSDDVHIDLAHKERLLRGEIQTYSMEKRYIRKNGSQVWVNLTRSLVRNQAGDPEWFVSVVQDITERKHAETALRESEERFRNMADTAPVMIWVSGPDKLCTFFNKPWLDFTGRTLEQELGDGWSRGVHREDVDSCIATYCSSFDARLSFHMEYRLRRADGECRWVLDNGTPLWSEGEFAGYIGSCIDITELKQYHKHMLAAQKMEGLGLMAAGVAHDFGNVLSAIFGEIDLALSEMEPESSARENVQRVEALAMHASEIVGMLRESAGGTSDSNPMEPLDVSSLVEQTLGFLTISISKRMTIRTSLPRDLPSVCGHMAQLRQVIVNLVTNAAEALNSGEGFITVTTDTVSLNPGHAVNNWANLPPGEYVRLAVSDSGCGMTPETCAKIFDQFFTTKSSGRGLGLAVVGGVVRSHGGAINVVSEPGAGSTFELLLPSVSRYEEICAD